ncbi:hypothetical protein F4824DRAFT_504327 [Ustulina deusta]|nr:hypothetical protein F4824DRAFT_504327 [Ustulina deusta]
MSPKNGLFRCADAHERAGVETAHALARKRPRKRSLSFLRRTAVIGLRNVHHDAKQPEPASGEECTIPRPPRWNMARNQGQFDGRASVDPVLDEMDAKRGRHPFQDLDIALLDGKAGCTSYRPIKNVYDAWMPCHLKKICSASNQAALESGFRRPGTE